MNRPWVKICGITTVEDARALAAAGVEAIGLNFIPESPRFVSIERARAIAEALPASVWRVGVFRDTAGTEVDRIVEEVGLDRIQLHGDESVDYAGRRSVPVIRAVQPRDGWDPSSLEAWRLFPILVDGYHPGLSGGTGRLADWTAARLLVERGYDVVLAGGLSPENVAAAVAAVGPSGVDLNSGVESAPGVKDTARVVQALEALGRGTRIS